jgi:hypothetical protein
VRDRIFPSADEYLKNAAITEKPEHAKPPLFKPLKKKSPRPLSEQCLALAPHRNLTTEKHRKFKVGVIPAVRLVVVYY